MRRLMGVLTRVRASGAVNDSFTSAARRAMVATKGAGGWGSAG